MRQPIDLVGGFYTDESLPWSCQDTVNWIPVAAEVGGTLTPTKLVDAPGLRPWVWIGNHADGVDSAPIRGLHDVEGQLFAVCGQTLYRIRPDGIAIPLGTIPGVGRVSMSHNQQAVGNQLLVVNGTGGYVWNTGTEEFTVVTDDGYPGAFAVDFLDGYLMQVEPFGRFLFHSDLADALDYNTLDRFEAETAPDRVVGMIVNHREVWAFGERTIDIFDNVGTATGTFQNKGISLSRGCIAKWSPAVIDNGIAWLGDDRVVYHARGYDAIRISTRAIEVALAEIPLTDIRNAFSFVWADRGHAVYYLTVPNGQTFGYDFSTGLWHRRASWHPERDIGGRWRLNDLVRHNGRWIGGDYQTGKLYELDWGYMLEGDQELVRERVSPVAHDDGRRFTTDAVELFFDTGGGSTSAGQFSVQPRGPSISGDAPNGTVAVTYSPYSYTITQGDAPIVRVEVIDGSLPDGLTFSDGTIEEGDPEKGGDFSFTVRVTDANGMWAQVVDSIRISTVTLMLFPTLGGTESGGVYVGGEDLDPAPPRFQMVPSLETNFINHHMAATADRSWLAVTNHAMIIKGPIPPYSVNVPIQTVASISGSGEVYLKGFGAVAFAFSRTHNPTTYLVSADNGDTWATVDCPMSPAGMLRMYGVARMGSGRWLAMFGGYFGHNKAYYSDADVPTSPSDWVMTPHDIIPSIEYGDKIDAREAGYVFGPGLRLLKTDDGESYHVVHDVPGYFGPQSVLFATSKGTVLVAGESEYVQRSDDGGESFDVVPLPGLDQCFYIFEANDRIYLSGVSSTGVAPSRAAVFVSEDDAKTFRAVEVPWAITFNNRAACLLPYERR